MRRFGYQHREQAEDAALAVLGDYKTLSFLAGSRSETSSLTPAARSI